MISPMLMRTALSMERSGRVCDLRAVRPGPLRAISLTRACAGAGARAGAAHA